MFLHLTHAFFLFSCFCRLLLFYTQTRLINEDSFLSFNFVDFLISFGLCLYVAFALDSTAAHCRISLKFIFGTHANNFERCKSWRCAMLGGGVGWNEEHLVANGEWERVWCKHCGTTVGRPLENSYFWGTLPHEIFYQNVPNKNVENKSRHVLNTKLYFVFIMGRAGLLLRKNSLHFKHVVVY